MSAIAFVISHPYVDALPCFREPIKALAGEGWFVDLYTTLSPLHPVPSFCRENVRLVPIEMTRVGVVRMIRQLMTHRPKYRWIFSVPQWSLHYAGFASRLARIPMACISDELISENELTTPQERKWKERERRAHQRCAFTIALSEERGDFIRRENRMPDDHPIYVLPNAAPGPARRLRSSYYREVLDIPEGNKILLHSGSAWWEPARKLAEAAVSWNGDWVLVFQGRMPTQMGWLANGGKSRVNPVALPSELLDYAVSSADIGIALYGGDTVNRRLMGTASGKICTYMKNSLPVITEKRDCFAWIEREKCGVCIGDISEVPAAAKQIWTSYEQYVSNVERWYAQKLTFDGRFADVESRLLSET